MALNIKPLGDRILVEPAEEKEVKKGGIIIPDTAKEKPQEGEVIAVGAGKMSDKGTRTPLDVKAGDRVRAGQPLVQIDPDRQQAAANVVNAIAVLIPGHDALGMLEQADVIGQPLQVPERRNRVGHIVAPDVASNSADASSR